MKKYFFGLILLFLLNNVFGQVGRGVYRFLDLPVSSRLATLGGVNVSLKDNDINFAFNNPALLSQTSNGVIGLNIANYLANIKYGSAIYSYSLNEKNFFSAGVQYIDYGTFNGYDEFGQKTEDFTAKDMAMYLSYARPLSDKITVGITLKPIVSALENYTSIGLVSDVGISYKKDDLLSVGLVFKNMGTQITGYYKDEDDKQHRESMPFDIQLGVTKKLAHAPIRISATLNNLHRWNVVGYQSKLPKRSSLTNEVKTEKTGFFDMALRHLILGIEFLPSDKFYLGVGYNHRRHKEMSIEGYKSLAGFSFGAGVKLYKFQVGFGMIQYQRKNYAYQFSISTNINDFIHL